MRGEQIMSLVRTRLAGVMLVAALLPACSVSSGPPRQPIRVTVTRPKKSVVAIPRQYACQIQSHHHIEVRTPLKGYLTAINVKEGQAVKPGDLLFEINSTLDKDGAPIASDDPGQIKAPFAGVIGSLAVPQVSAVQIGETLATLSDSSQMRIDFKVSEAGYREYERANLTQHPEDVKVELVVNGDKFNHTGKLEPASMNLSPQHGQYTLRADFPNPDGLLHQGQTGTLIVSLTQHYALVIPQQATFADHDERYVYVVDKTNIAHRRRVEVQGEVDDLFVIQSGVDIDETIVLEGIGKIQDGETVQYDAP